MNFIWFLLATILFYLFYWYVLSWIILFPPSIPIMVFIRYLTEHTEKRWTKIALIPTFVIGFIIGTLLPSAIFGMGTGVIALNFAEKATHPLIYFLLAGFSAFTISAPTGETSLLGMLISLVSYVITVTISKFTLFSTVTIGFLTNLALWGLGFLILVGIVSWFISFLDTKITKRTEFELQQEPDGKLSIGVYIFSILSIVLGMLWVISFLIYPVSELLGYFICGVPLLVGGIGMLREKYWALRVSQVIFVVFALQCAVAIPIYLLNNAKKLGLSDILFAFFILFIFIGLPIWFLFRKSTVLQFKRKQ